jgi:hypothetical protein
VVAFPLRVATSLMRCRMPRPHPIVQPVAPR